MIKILFFARLREQLGQMSHTVDINDLAVPRDVNSVLELLISTNPQWSESLSSPDLCFAIDQEQAQRSSLVDSASEIAIFPPVTGG